MIKSPEQLDELINRVQNHGDFSVFQRQDPSSVNLVSIISNIPKAEIPKANLLKVRAKILDRISLPDDTETQNTWFAPSFLQYIPRFMRITGGLVGGFMILISLTMGTAVAALESVPGQHMYPLKKIVENVQFQLAFTQKQKTDLQIKFANTRINELETILQKQQEGKVSEAEAQKIVAATVKGIQKTSEEVAEQSKTEPQVDVLNKIATLSNKQTAVIQAAQILSEGEVKVELEKALEISKTTHEMAIENIEKAGGVLDKTTSKEGTVTAEGKLTAAFTTSISIGTTHFQLTKDTEYVNIKPEELKVGTVVRITGEVKEDKKTYATKIELSVRLEETQHPTETPKPATEEVTPTPVPTSTQSTENPSPETITTD
ncbi:MAG: hypothetical protein KW793_03435 [Candidatus Doudnabacteria bacterium]|nr:hypothetical protein [Candidatus Doudnabacteria bacterium]